jgi:hypothetical protein
MEDGMEEGRPNDSDKVMRLDSHFRQVARGGCCRFLVNQETSTTATRHITCLHQKKKSREGGNSTTSLQIPFDFWQMFTGFQSSTLGMSFVVTSRLVGGPGTKG